VDALGQNKGPAAVHSAAHTLRVGLLSWMMVRIKICGIKTLEDVERARRSGVDAIGVLVGRLHASADFVSADTAAALCERAHPFLTTVLVTHLEEDAVILDLARAVPAAVIQLHNDLPPERVRELRSRLRPRKVIAHVGVVDQTALKRAALLQDAADALVLDSVDRAQGRIGGTGKTHDWSISAEIARTSRLPVILAGGLTPANVAEAIAAVRPSAVDVNSGVKAPGGHKSPELVSRFVAAVRNAG
jgi:phosphoribosylanthranilate isomerase